MKAREGVGLISYMIHIQGSSKEDVCNTFPLCRRTEQSLGVYVSFLGCVDKIGIAFEAPTISTGFGAYLAQVRLSPLVMSLYAAVWRKVAIHKNVKAHATAPKNRCLIEVHGFSAL